MNGKDDLITLCTMVVFTASAKHAAVNFLQFEYGSFAPVSPSTMRGDLPTETDRGKISKEFIFESLPDPEICIRFAAIVFTLTEIAEDEVFLLLKNTKKSGGELASLPPRWLFTEENVTAAFHNFQIELEEIESKINDRNENLAIPYSVLLPSRIPFGIAI
jgi:hypothetical protein